MKPSLFAHPFASYCQKVLIALYENGTDFTYRKFGPEDPTAMSELTALWPLKKFPVLLDEGQTYVESSVIIEHLANSSSRRRSTYSHGSATARSKFG